MEDEFKRGLEMFGVPGFRAGQREVVEAMCRGDDVLVVMPTGSGKSLCFQLPAMIGKGLTLCVSPLIALMKDQEDALVAKGLPACCVTSHLSPAEQQDRLDAVARGEIRLLYVAPERLGNPAFLTAVRSIGVERLVVDEAHCVSQWGHDFRPDYLRISDLKQKLGDPPIAALTATATHLVQQDIMEQLGMEDPEVMVHGFERPNLEFEVVRAPTQALKLKRMIRIVRASSPGAVVVYCATRKETMRVAGDLQKAGLSADAYHGGMSEQTRAEVQDDWMSGRVQVLAATNAFGMGVDKSDVRAVIHQNIPGSIEAYYQEAGRAGRDGERSRCVVLYAPTDRGIHDFFIRNSYPDARWFERVWALLSELPPDDRFTTTIDALSRDVGDGYDRLHPMAADTILRRLQSERHIGHLDRAGSKRMMNVLDPGYALRVDLVQLGKRRQTAVRQLEDVIAWAEGAGCRQTALVRYFNSTPTFGERCEVCDYCRETGDGCDVTELTRKVLSGVARSGGEVGRASIVSMLVGRSNPAVRAHSLDATATFGVLATLRAETVADVLTACERGGLVDGRRRRGRRLTAAGATVLRGDKPVNENTQKSIRTALRKARR